MRDVLFVLALLVGSGLAYILLDKAFEGFDEGEDDGQDTF